MLPCPSHCRCSGAVSEVYAAQYGCRVLRLCYAVTEREETQQPRRHGIGARKPIQRGGGGRGAQQLVVAGDGAVAAGAAQSAAASRRRVTRNRSVRRIYSRYGKKSCSNLFARRGSGGAVRSSHSPRPAPAVPGVENQKHRARVGGGEGSWEREYMK